MPNPVGRRGASSRRKGQALSRVAAALGGYAQFKQEKSRYEEKLRREAEDERRRREEFDRLHPELKEGQLTPAEQKAKAVTRSKTTEARGLAIKDRGEAREARLRDRLEGEHSLKGRRAAEIAAGKEELAAKNTESQIASRDASTAKTKADTVAAGKPKPVTPKAPTQSQVTRSQLSTDLHAPLEGNRYSHLFQEVKDGLAGGMGGQMGFKSRVSQLIRDITDGDASFGIDEQAEFYNAFMAKAVELGVQEIEAGWLDRQAEILAYDNSSNPFKRAKDDPRLKPFGGPQAQPYTPGPAGSYAAPAESTAGIGPLGGFIEQAERGE